MLEHNGHSDYGSSEPMVLELEGKFRDALGESRPVAADAVGVCESKTIFLRQALVNDSLTGLSLITYPYDTRSIARSALKITHSVLETEDAVELRNTIEVHDHREKLREGEIARIILERRNSDRWRCQIKEVGKNDGAFVLRTDRVATIEDMAFFNGALGYALYFNIEDALVSETMMKPEDLIGMVPYISEN
jgi:hypothetical protein